MVMEAVLRRIWCAGTAAAERIRPRLVMRSLPALIGPAPLGKRLYRPTRIGDLAAVRLPGEIFHRSFQLGARFD
jgi:hypothetical protein